MKLSVNQQGFVTNWLISGPACARYKPPADLSQTWEDQLGYEKALRGVFYSGTNEMPPQTILLGKVSPNGENWRYYYYNRNWFVDVSNFYDLPTTIRVDAATILHCESARTVSAALWTYAAVDLWVNGKQILHAQAPVYKPIRKYEIELPLQQGQNTIYVIMHNLGVRDTRNLFGLQLKQSSAIAVDLPDSENAAPFVALDQWLSSLTYKNGVLTVPTAPPRDAVLELSEDNPIMIAEAGTWKIPDTVSKFTVHGIVGGLSLSRRFELMEHLHAINSDDVASDHRRRFLEHIAADQWEPRGNGIYFSVFHVLARRILGLTRPDDDELLMRDLDFVESCGDCSDFVVIGFFRLLHNYEVSDPVKTRAKEVLLSFRYWMDENGSDGMCYWSENHALMFYGAQLVAGQMFPNDVFTRSGRTGQEQSVIGAARCRSWLDDVERDGAEEFNSASYMPVTLAALLNLVDYAPDDISVRASAVLDSLMRQLCLHVFQKSVISPQGRVYRDVIYPYRQSVQSLLHMVSVEFPYSDAENIWDVNLFTSRYKFPEDLMEIARQEVHKTYVSGNARIVLEKTADYVLTSVQCPRASDDTPTWHNLCFDKNADRNTNTYVKSLNERFHGTSIFEPGVYGYQQHLWYAAVSSECVVFANHPGSAVDLDGMRPGYWYGNGVFPAVKQIGNVLGTVFEIPDNHPITFTHVFWPADKFDESLQNGHWLFGQSKNGYVGLWCSGTLEAVDDVLNACEYRCYGTHAAYYCVCGSAAKGTFSDFADRCKAAKPVYDVKNSTLKADEGYTLTYIPHENKTQYI